MSEIKRIPFHPVPGSDPIYDALMAAGEDAVLCLILEIDNRSPMKDPRQAPTIHGYMVGDTAFFVLWDILGQDLDMMQFFPQDVREDYEKNGIYAYVAYRADPNNQKHLQYEILKWWVEQREKGVRVTGR